MPETSDSLQLQCKEHWSESLLRGLLNRERWLCVWFVLLLVRAMLLTRIGADWRESARPMRRMREEELHDVTKERSESIALLPEEVKNASDRRCAEEEVAIRDVDEPFAID